MTQKSAKTTSRMFGKAGPLVLVPLLLGAVASSSAFAKDGGWAEGWGSGTIVSAVQPGTSNPCDSRHPCEIAVQGSGDTKSSFGAGPEIGQFGFQADLTIDLALGTPNGSGQQCFPVTGALSLRRDEKNARFGMLVVDVQGEECAFGASTTLSALAATYAVDGTQSTGKFSGAAGTGAVSATIDTSRSPASLGFSFSGSLGSAAK